MDFFKSVTTIAQNAIESINNPNHLTKDQLIQEAFHLPSSEHIINEINADYIITSRVLYSFSNDKKVSNTYLPIPTALNTRVMGKITVTEHYLVVKHNDSTHDKVIFHLSSIAKVQKIPNVEVVHFRLYTNNGMILDVLADTVRSKAEYFLHLFIKQYELNKKNIDTLTDFQKSLYSEYLISKNCKNTKLGEKHIEVPAHPAGGLGLKYKFPGNQSKEKESLKRWFEYFRRYGRNLELVQNSIYNSLVLHGIPARLRGEIWELSYGAMYSRFANSTEYEKMLSDNKDKKSIAIDEIEKDLNRSLPEYPAFQTDEGINKLRRVLTAYSWKNPEVGYCQAMNIVVAALLIFMTEEQAYWTLIVLCDKLIPGYYSKTMYGVLLDQKVFEALVKNTMPAVGEHFTKHDIQLSIVSLPWFLSLFLNTMPLIFAFRVMDAFFLHGPKKLFQVALGIIKVNSTKLLECTDDGECIAVFKEYFASLDEVAPKHEKFKRKFDILWEVSNNEFDMIDEFVLIRNRNKFKNEVFEGIDLFVKRAEIRNLPKTPNLNNEQLSNIYDIYYMVVLQDKNAPNRGNMIMDFDSFKIFMSKIVPWVYLERTNTESNTFLHRLYDNWSNERNEMSLETLVIGLNDIVEKDLMNALSNFYNLYDENKIGKIPKETVLQLAEDLIYITTPWREGFMFDSITNREIEDQIAERLVQRREALKKQGVEVNENDEIALPDEVKFDQEKWKSKQSVRYLSASSNFLQLAFKYAQPYEDTNAPLIDLYDENDKKINSITHNRALDPTHPVYITPSMFRMVVLANDTYSSFFETQLWSSFTFDRPDDAGMLGEMVGNIRGMMTNFMADGARVASQVKKRIDARKNTLDSTESRSSSMTSASGASVFTKATAATRTSMESKGDSIITGFTIDSSLPDELIDNNIDDLLGDNEESNLLSTNNDSEDDNNDDDFGNFVPANNEDKLNEITRGTSNLNV